jgi:hypothetical protein
MTTTPNAKALSLALPLNAFLAYAREEGVFLVQWKGAQVDWHVLTNDQRAELLAEWKPSDPSPERTVMTALTTLADALAAAERARADRDAVMDGHGQMVMDLEAARAEADRLRAERESLLNWASCNLGNSLVHKRIREHFGLPVDAATMASPEVHAVRIPASAYHPFTQGAWPGVCSACCEGSDGKLHAAVPSDGEQAAEASTDGQDTGTGERAA